MVVIDEAHTFVHERKGTSPEIKAHNALVAEVTRLVEEIRQHPEVSPVLLNDPAYAPRLMSDAAVVMDRLLDEDA